MGDRDAQIQIVKQKLIDQGYPPHVAEEMAVHRVGTMSGYYGVKARSSKELNNSLEFEAENIIDEIFGVTAILGGPPTAADPAPSGQPSSVSSVASHQTKSGNDSPNGENKSKVKSVFGKVKTKQIKVADGLLPTKDPHMNEMIKMKAIEDEFGIS